MATPKNLHIKKTIIAGLIGNAIEFYDFIVYAYLAAYFAAHFSPINDPIHPLDSKSCDSLATPVLAFILAL